MRALTLKQKLLFSQIILVVLFILASFPIVEYAVETMIDQNLDLNTQELIQDLLRSDNENQLVEKLSDVKSNTFARLTLYDASGHTLYDALLTKGGEESELPEHTLSREEIRKLADTKEGFVVENSLMNKKKGFYFLNSFELHSKLYILRTAMTFQNVGHLQKNLNTWFIGFSVICWMFFSAITWLILYRLHRPIEQIIEAVRPYQGDRNEEIPEILIRKDLAFDEGFNKLADTLNSLSKRIAEQLKTLKAERNEKEAILESLEEGVISFDKQGTIRYINTTAAKMLYHDKKQLKYSSLIELSKMGSSLLTSSFLKLIQLSKKEGKSVRETLLDATNKKTYYDVIAVPKAASNGNIIVIQDTTSHYKILEVGKDFIANASHELRTPITIIRGFAETLHDMPDLPKETVADITDKIVRNCQRMDALIKNLLLLSDIENMPPKRLRESELISLLEDSIELTKNVYPDARITFNKKEPVITAFIDPDLLELAIVNLLHNACKYSSPPADITLLIDKQKDKVIIQISDKGIGIPPQDIDHIFDRFYTVDKAHSRKLGGAGLGLSIVKTIIEKHEGAISVDSTLGQGSTFTLTLPLIKDKTLEMF